MQRNHRLVTAALVSLLAAGLAPRAGSASHADTTSHDHRAMVPNGCQPLGTHAIGDIGCYIVAQESLAALPEGPLFLHLDLFADADAARSARGTNDSVVQAYGRTWLLTIAEQSWRPKGGEHAATIGPFAPLTSGPQLASYMVATTDPNMDSAPHTHAGPEIFYVVEGAQCLETPDGARHTRAGEGHVVAGGVPMKLYGAGDTTRRALVLVLHDATQPVVIRDPQWQPKGTCLDARKG